MQVNDGPRKDGRRRRRRRRRGGRNRSGGGGGKQQQQQSRIDPNDERMRAISKQSVPSGPEELNQFNLFCAYHLGITRADSYKFQSLGEVARRFNVDPNIIKQKLKDYHLESESLRALGFDSEMMQLDIRVAPEGVSRRALGRTIFDELDLPEPIESEPEEPEVEEPEAEAPEAEAEAPESEAEASSEEDGAVSDDDGASEEDDDA